MHAAGRNTRDDVVRAMRTQLQLSSARWLVIYSTHGYRGVDDERSIIYQVRRDAPDGAVLKEGFLARGPGRTGCRRGQAPAEGKSYYKTARHMVAFGVPRAR